MYRGAFVLNYALAVAAVGLATLSLVLITKANTTHHDFFPYLLGALVLLKLVLLGCITRNTYRANNEHWNDNAIDYRYLAERLRTMFYLPRLGSFQSPAAASCRSSVIACFALTRTNSMESRTRFNTSVPVTSRERVM